MSETARRLNGDENESVVLWRLTQIERAQEKVTVAIEDFRRDLSLLATKSDLAKAEERLDALEDKVDHIQERVGATWIKVSAVGGGLLAVVGTIAQIYLGGR